MTDHNEAMRLAEPPSIGNLQKIAASDSITAIRNALLASIKWIHCLEQSLTFEQAASFRDQVDALTAERDTLRTDLHIARDDAAQMLASTQALRAELETEHMRLAACGVVAMANTAESAAKARDMHPDYLCASVLDVAAAVDREMALRAEVERLRVDAERIDYLEYEANELRTRETAEDDYEWVVRSNHMDQPHERDVATGKTIRTAIDTARKATT